MKAKLSNTHPGSYVKVEVKRGLYVTVDKRERSYPEIYRKAFEADSSVTILDATTVKAETASKKTIKKEKLFTGFGKK